MAAPKILLFYAFTPLPDPQAIRLWQRGLCESLGLRGRILISKDGINGTVGGDVVAIKKYVREMREYEPFGDIDFKRSDGTADAAGRSADFPRLSVKVRDELVSFGAPGELSVDEHGVVGGGTRLTADELHRLVAERGEEVVFFDGRNALEAEIGRFKDAIVPDVAYTRDFVAELDSGRYDDLKAKPVVTYCTGGIRCEVLSSLMVSRGFEQVYQLDGGIVKYGERFGDEGLWEGSLLVFDERRRLEFSEQAAVIGRCHRCGAATSQVLDCDDLACLSQLVICEACAAASSPVCGVHADRDLPTPLSRSAATKPPASGLVSSRVARA